MMATSALTIAFALLMAALTAAPAGAAPPVAGLAAPTAAGAPAGADQPRRARSTTVRTRLGVLQRRLRVRAGRIATVSGRVLPRRAGRLVVLQRRSAARWVTIARSRTTATGRYRLRHRTSGMLSAPVRVRVVAARGARRDTRRIGRIEAFRPALASWYGPGFYGGPLACGGRLGYRHLGVAHKTLPCGTKVTIRYRGRQVRVPVTDRGPFSGAREFDLGPGVRAALRFGGVGTVQVAH
jgi:outer membrane receptor protein involved in Fe transport